MNNFDETKEFLIKDILPNFNLLGDVSNIEIQENGLINSTFVVTTLYSQEKIERKYILQKINTSAFKNPYIVMQNIVTVTEHIKRNHPEETTIELVRCKDSDENMFIYKNGLGDQQYWRMYKFVENSLVFNSSNKPEIFQNIGIGYAQFHRSLSDLDISLVKKTIPDFHNSRKRYLDLKETLKNDPLNRLQTCKEEVAFILSHRHDFSYITELLEEGAIPLRITHNDTKINNVLLNQRTLQPLCVIDLDTIMPGTILFDIADTIRSGANTTAEDYLDLSKVDLDLNILDAFLDGYMSIMNDFLTDEEVKHIPIAIFIITMELATRFLKDYLDGDIYFQIKDPKRPLLNLERAQNQLALAKKIKENLHVINYYVCVLRNKYNKQKLARIKPGNN